VEVREIFQEAENCSLCNYDKIKVPLFDPKNGTKNVKIMFVNERPGRIGTGQSGYVSFDNNDKTANLFKDCFEQLSLDRTQIFITNACICYPDLKEYRDKKPSAKELKNCSHYLKKQVAATNPKLIVTLGMSALNAMKYLFPESKEIRNYKTFKKDIGTVIKDTSPWIYPVYHTSPRVQNSLRKPEQQKKDWLKINELLLDA